jgi:PAS domain S-box-containing protein
MTRGGWDRTGDGPDEPDDVDPPHETASHAEQRASAVLDALPEIVYVLDEEGRLVDWNGQLEATTGYEPSDLDGRHASTLLDGEEDALAACLDPVLDEGEATSRDVLLVTADDDTVPHHLTAGPLYEGDELVGVAGTAHDISDQLAHERAVEEKNARLERFASIVSHDLRNPLAVADGYLELAQRETDAPYLDEIEAAHDRMGELIDDVLTLTRSGSDLEEPSSVDLTGVATDAWDVVETEGATLRVTDLGTVEADRSRLRQLFENLFRNSVEHGSTSDRSATRSDDSAEHGSTGSQGGRDRPDDSVEHGGPTVEVTVAATDDGFYVADDGPGLPDGGGDPFEDGVSTKPEGTGLGLSIVESIANAHGWTVEATESESGGARFEFRF